MSKGSYLGGGTIINPGSGFFSYNKSAIKINAEDDFLKRCIKAEINNEDYPAIPDLPKLSSSIISHGGLKAWLGKHPNYNFIKKKALKAKNKKEDKKYNLTKKASAKLLEQKHKESEYLKEFILCELKRKPVPQNKPKGFLKKYKNDYAIRRWALNHPDYLRYKVMLFNIIDK